MQTGYWPGLVVIRRAAASNRFVAEFRSVSSRCKGVDGVHLRPPGHAASTVADESYCDVLSGLCVTVQAGACAVYVGGGPRAAKTVGIANNFMMCRGWWSLLVDWQPG